MFLDKPSDLICVVARDRSLSRKRSVAEIVWKKEIFFVFEQPRNIAKRLGIMPVLSHATVTITFIRSIQPVRFLSRGVFLTAAVDIMRSFSILPDPDPLPPSPKPDTLVSELFLPRPEP